jgi:hypothetical protein
MRSKKAQTQPGRNGEPAFCVIAHFEPSGSIADEPNAAIRAGVEAGAVLDETCGTVGGGVPIAAYRRPAQVGFLDTRL